MKFVCIGGDMRIVSLAEMLLSEGQELASFALDEAPKTSPMPHSASAQQALDGADCVIFPLPMRNARGGLNAPLSSSFHRIEDIMPLIPKTALVCGGRPDDETLAVTHGLGLNFADYFDREELVLLNALLTAEGALSILLQSSAISVWDSRILIIGAGRIGKLLGERLRALGAQVSISARKYKDLAHIRAMGCRALNTEKLGGELSDFDTIINTVPSLVMDKARLSLVSPSAVCIDLASRPGGFDFEAAKDLQLNLIWALGLPGSIAPKTAARIIKETVFNIISDQRGD